MKQPVQADEKPAAYFYNQLNHGYVALYQRENIKLQYVDKIREEKKNEMELNRNLLEC